MKRKLLGLAVLIGMIGALLASTTSALGDHPAESSLAQDGTLQLHLDPVDPGADPYADFFSYTPNGGASVTQTIPQPGNCEFRGGNSVNGPLVTLTSTAGKPGFFDDGIGNRIRGARGSKCGLVDGFDEDLILELSDAGLDERWIKSAELDIEFKFDAVIAVELWHTKTAGDVLIDTRVFDCSGLSDCGPDSADGDNVRVLVEAQPAALENGLFDKMVFRLHATSPGNGAFALAGGADGTPAWPGGIGEGLGTLDSVFDIWRTFDGILDCGDTVSETDGTLTGTFTRIDDSGSDPCDLKPYDLEVNLGGVDPLDDTVLFEPEGDPATYSARLTKSPDLAANPQNLPELEYDPFGVTYQTMPWCIDPVIDDEYPDSRNPGTFITVVTSAIIPNGPNDPNAPDPPTETWCIARIETDVVPGGSPGSNYTQSTWTIFGLDDPSYGWK